MARAALEAGKHVAVDKPFTLDAGQARELAALAARQGRVLSVYQNRRFDSDFLTLQELLASGELGRPVYFESHFDRFRRRCAIAGANRRCPAPGSGSTSAPIWSTRRCSSSAGPTRCSWTPLRCASGALVEDYFHAVLRYESGEHAPLRVVLHATTLAAFPAPRYIVHGTRGSYLKRGVDPQEDALRAGSRPGAAQWGADPVDGELTLIGLDGSAQTQPLPTQAGNYMSYYAAVRDAIWGKGPNPVTPEQAVELMELLDLGRQSAAEGRALAAR